MNIEEKVNISILLDYYGGLLPESQMNIMKMRFNEDLTLSEIAQSEGISRQGVRDSIVRGVKLLYEYDGKLNLKDKISKIRTKLLKIRDAYPTEHIDILSELDRVIKGLEEN